MSLMERFAREDVRRVMHDFGVTSCRRVADTDATEEIFLVSGQALAAVNVERLTLALMEVLPHKKVWVIEDESAWSGEAL